MKTREWKTVWKADIEVDMRVEGLDAPEKIVKGGQQHKMFRFVTANKRDGAVTIVEKENKIALVKHNRLAIEKVSLELPQGMGDVLDKDGIETGMREAEEELGIKVSHGISLGQIFADSAITANKIHVITCKYEHDSGVGDGEIISVHWTEKDEVVKLIKDSKIKDGISIAALMKYFIYKKIV
ncbi:MAG: NUDIX hydrolase [Erysipelothrix sp.]|nr:NUDIX hydrolase [Erysipelothrix sp.]